VTIDYNKTQATADLILELLAELNDEERAEVKDHIDGPYCEICWADQSQSTCHCSPHYDI